MSFRVFPKLYCWGVVTCVAIVSLLIGIPLLMHTSNSPLVLGRYSVAWFMMTLTWFGASILLAVISIRSEKAAIGIPVSAVLFCIAFEVCARLFSISGIVPYSIWLDFPYSVRKASLESYWSDTYYVYDDDFMQLKPHWCTCVDAESGRVCHDEIGFRNPLGWYHQNEQISIVTLGDSFTHGLCVQAAWPETLGEITGNSVLNLGIPGAAPQHWVEALLRYGLAKHPKAVVVAVYDGNDFSDGQRWSKLSAHGDDFRAYQHRITPRTSEGLLGRMADHSVILHLVLGLWDGTLSLSEPGRSSRAVTIDGGATQVTLPMDVKIPDSGLAIRERAEGYVIYEQALREIKRISAEIDAEMIVVHFTTVSVIYAPYVENPTEALLQDVANERFINVWLGEKSDEIGFTYVDTTPALRRRAASGPVLYDISSHFSQAGNNAIAAVVASTLQLEGLLDRISD